VQKLIHGVERFRREHYRPNQLFFEQLAAKQQKPIALFITCADSRVNPNLITQTEPGDLFLIRNAGNIVPPYGAPGGEAATIEYSIEVLGIRDVIICGHSQCGAIQALVAADAMSRLPAVSAWCHHAEATRRIVQHKYCDLTLPELTAIAAQENVLVQINHLSTHPCVAARLANGELRVFGWYYDIGAGQILQYDQAAGHFERLNGTEKAAALAPVLALAAADG
jgi:carbonic anhydrase